MTDCTIITQQLRELIRVSQELGRSQYQASLCRCPYCPPPQFAELGLKQRQLFDAIVSQCPVQTPATTP